MWPRLYNSLNFLEKTKLCYISFYTGKIPQTFLLLLVSLVSHFCSLHNNVCIGDLSFILLLRFSIAEEKQSWLAKQCRISSCSSDSFRDTTKKRKKGNKKRINYKYWNTKHYGKNNLRSFPNFRYLYQKNS